VIIIITIIIDVIVARGDAKCVITMSQYRTLQWRRVVSSGYPRCIFCVVYSTTHTIRIEYSLLGCLEFPISTLYTNILSNGLNNSVLRCYCYYVICIIIFNVQNLSSEFIVMNQTCFKINSTIDRLKTFKARSGQPATDNRYSRI